MRVNLVSKKGTLLGTIEKKRGTSGRDRAVLIRIRLDPIYIQLTEEDDILGIEREFRSVLSSELQVSISDSKGFHARIGHTRFPSRSTLVVDNCGSGFQNISNREHLDFFPGDWKSAQAMLQARERPEPFRVGFFLLVERV